MLKTHPTQPLTTLFLKRSALAALTVLSLTPTLSSFARADAQWASDQNPKSFLFLDEKLESNFSKLRPEANVGEKDGHIPWSETYWPGYRGGIAYRYMQNAKDADAFTATHYSREALLAMEPSARYELIKTLSPAEKLDIMNGDYDYPLTRRVISTYSPTMPKWMGICHGWGPSAAAYPEPQNTTYTNKDGIKVDVGSSDMKALMSYYYAWEAAQYNDREEANFSFVKDENGVSKYTQTDPNKVPFIYRGLGERCVPGTGTCGGRGLDPAAFHLALSNVVGNYQRSFVVNVVANKQVWNQPVYGYSSKVLETKKVKSNSPDEVATQVLVNTQLYYVSEPWDRMHYDPRGTQLIRGYAGEEGDAINGNGVFLLSKNLVYWLDLDGNGNVVGGRWNVGFLRTGLFMKKDHVTDRIGFAWRASRVPFTGKFSVLNKIYKSEATKTTSYAATRNYTPGLEDTYFEVNASTIPTYDWTIANLGNP